MIKTPAQRDAEYLGTIATILEIVFLYPCVTIITLWMLPMAPLFFAVYCAERAREKANYAWNTLYPKGTRND